MLKQYVFLEDRLSNSTRYYSQPVGRIIARQAYEVTTAFKLISEALSRGYYIAGYFSYELGYILEPHLNRLLPSNRKCPLVNLGIFKDFKTNGMPEFSGEQRPQEAFMPDWNRAKYKEAFNKVLEKIIAGEVYQTNLTFPMRCKINIDPVVLYRSLCIKQPVEYGGIVSLGNPVIISLSPELFFKRDCSNITMRPMKGTIKRGFSDLEDIKLANQMKDDKKTQAENLMIVDLIRNDLSRISEIGTVNVTQLYGVESYPTLHQMTSTIVGNLRSGLTTFEILKSLFPCGSVTGAPKIRAMEIIRELEHFPREIYCGAIGFIDPSGLACFNVAIRSMSIFDDGSAVYNTGSAIVSDSNSDKEYEECLLKAKFLE